MDEDLSPPERAIEDECAALLLEMAGLRAVEVPPSDADPPVVHEKLRDDLRPRLDRAEGLMKEMAGYKRIARRAVWQYRAEAEDAYDAELARLARAAMRLEYQSVHDRIAMAKVASTQLRRRQRAAERALDLVEEAEEAMKGMYFGLRDIRREMLAALEYLPWERSLER